jgi:hypothetical protein
MLYVKCLHCNLDRKAFHARDRFREKQSDLDTNGDHFGILNLEEMAKGCVPLDGPQENTQNYKLFLS